MSYFPDNAESKGLVAFHDLDGAVEVAEMDVFWSGTGAGRARYMIWRLGTALEARRMFGSLAYFDLIPLESCPDLKDLTIYASEASVQCGDPGFGGFNAELLARYEEYVISLLVHPSSQMTYPEIARVMQFVDRQMRHRLHWAPQEGETEFDFPETPPVEAPNNPCFQRRDHLRDGPCHWIRWVSRTATRHSPAGG